MNPITFPLSRGTVAPPSRTCRPALRVLIDKDFYGFNPAQAGAARGRLAVGANQSAYSDATRISSLNSRSSASSRRTASWMGHRGGAQQAAREVRCDGETGGQLPWPRRRPSASRDGPGNPRAQLAARSASSR
jgi:hypothetical protein